jgi:hypothetical protein
MMEPKEEALEKGRQIKRKCCENCLTFGKSGYDMPEPCVCALEDWHFGEKRTHRACYLWKRRMTNEKIL